MNRRMRWMLIIVGVLLGGVFGFEIFRGMMIKKFMSSMGLPPQTVSTTVAGTQEWQDQLQAVGSLRAVRGVDIANELPGTVGEINFDSGDDVDSGAMLIKMRAEDEIGKLQALIAAEKLAQVTYDRDLRQFKAQAISQAVLDTDAANLASAKAQVAAQQAIVDKKQIRAPFAGHLGIRAVDVGQYLNPGSLIVTLQQLDPIFLDFYLPQQTVAQLALDQKVVVKNDTYPDKVFNGTIKAINPKVEPATRNVQVRAELANPEHLLLPGMYATASIAVGEPHQFITLPQTAITYNPYGNTVFLAEPKELTDEEKEAAAKNDKDKPPVAQFTAKQTFVTLGTTRGDQVAVLKGVKEGDQVVTAGQIKLMNGTPLIVDNTVQPTSDPDPKPQDK